MRNHAPLTNPRASLRAAIALLTALGFAACSSYENHPAHIASAPTARTFTLNSSHRADPASGVTLIHVRPDGAATIRTGTSSGLATARPGAYFDSQRFGRHGLQLVNSSPATSSATFQQASTSER
jgi:hypothetical protein